MRSCLLFSFVVLSSCRLEPEPPELPPRALPSQTASASGVSSVEWRPGVAGGLVAPVAQARVALASPQPVASAAVVLVRGELSDTAMKGLREGSLPASARARVVPAQVDARDGVVRLAPSLALEPGQAYTLAIGSLDLRASVVVGPASWPVLARVWPPPGEPSGRDEAVFCGSLALPAGLTAHGFGEATVAPGAVGHEAPGCVTLAGPGEPRAWLLPAALAAGDEVVALLAPGPLVPGERPAADAVACGPDEAPFGPGCVRVLDDRALWRLPAEPWLLVGGTPRVLGPAAVLRGLSPASSALLEATVVDLRGQTFAAALAVSTLPALAHVVINEVLADALGPEPAAEWVELVNDGATPVDLAGWTLDDGGGSTPLPAAVLPPGAHALLVNEAFDPSGDVAPPAGCPLLSVAHLGQGGLSNQGEALVLRDPTGQPISRWPASPRPKAGVSVARRRPDAPDDEVASFALAAGGRPTPCAANYP